MTEKFVRKLAEECVAASYRTTDVRAASKLLQVGNELLKYMGEPERPKDARACCLSAAA